jgi:hypothetical protein
MRIGMVSSFCAFLLWIYSPLPTVAQANPVSEQRSRTFSSVKLFELPKLPVSSGVGFRTDFAIELPKCRNLTSSSTANKKAEPRSEPSRRARTLEVHTYSHTVQRLWIPK